MTCDQRRDFLPHTVRMARDRPIGFFSSRQAPAQLWLRLGESAPSVRKRLGPVSLASFGSDVARWPSDWLRLGKRFELGSGGSGDRGIGLASRAFEV